MWKQPKLFLIYRKSFRNTQERLDSLSSAAIRKNITPVFIDSEEFDFSEWQQIEDTRRNLFYNVTPFSHEIENIFIHKGLTSLFRSPNKINYLFSTHQFDLSLMSAGIPVPKTILKGTNHRNLLKNYVEFLGGFPIILKATGGTLGVGVVKVESWDSLISTADLLMAREINFLLKEYIQNKGTIRAIVLGDEVICSIIRLNPENDFRCSSPSTKSILQPFKCSKELEETAVKATIAANYDFAGVDIVQGKSGKHYVLEVNYPNDFTIPSNLTGIDVADMMVQYLLNKSLLV